jgi:dipeptidyl aminopeptidase/acylaminoacyl peptidase
VVTDDHGGFSLEGWGLESSGPRRRFALPVPEPTRIVGLPVEDGRTVLVDYATSMLTVLDGEGRPDRAPFAVEGARFFPAQAGAALAVGLRRTESGSRVLLVQPDGVVQAAAVDAPLSHSWPLGNGRMVLRAEDGSAYLLELGSGRADRMADESIPDGAVLLGTAAERLVLVDQQSWGCRLLLGSLTERTRVLPLPAGVGRATPVAVDPAGERLALVVQHGALSRLMLLDDCGSVPIGQAAAALLPAAGWTANGVWGIGSAPDRPSDYYWLAPAGGSLRWPTAAEPGPAARLENFQGADGTKLEAVAYGPDWHTADRVVLALHGGPRDHWRMSYDPTLRPLADSGTCVIAINQRGSTGYGSEFELAIKGCWGGPDLADIRAVAGQLRSRRRAGSRAPGLYGTSYGAFLALLAAAAEPDGWACCVAVSPFASAEALYASAGPRVRALLDRLDARQPVADELGPRDLLRLAPRIRCPVLIAHGRLDDRIPVEQARAIASAITGAPLRYLELPDRGHAVLRPHPADAVLRAAIALLGGAAIASCSRREVK